MSTTLDLDGETLTLPTANDTSWDVNLNNTIASIVTKSNEHSDSIDTLAPAATAVTLTGTQTLENKTLAGPVSGAAFPLEPGGRLTLTTAVPVTTSDVTGATTVYYTPRKHNVVWLYNGTTWTSATFTETSQATTDATKSPAAAASNTNYDMFVWNDSGTIRCTRGPAWSSDTSPGTGAGTSERELFEGRYVNKNAITNGPNARRGLYVGTIRTDGSSQVNDSAAKRHVWNNYNRVARAMRVLETTDTWTYTTATFRQARATTTNQLDLVRGLDEDAVSAEVRAVASNTSAGVNTFAGVGLDSTTALAPGNLAGGVAVQTAGIFTCIGGMWRGLPGIGRHTLVWLEYSSATGTCTWYGDAGGLLVQSGIHGECLA